MKPLYIPSRRAWNIATVRGIEIPEISGIYKITNLINEKVYIGYSNNIRRRFYAHRSHSSTIFIHSAIKKYGLENFSISILEKVDSEDLLNVAEEGWIAVYDATNSIKGYNYLKRDRTAKGHEVSQATREKLRKTHREKFLNGAINPMQGKKHSSESIKKMIATKKERSFTYNYAALNKSVNKIDTVTLQIVKCYKSITEAAEDSNISCSFISTVARKEKLQRAGGFYWRYPN